MATQIYVCPQCGCPDLEGEQTRILLSPAEHEIQCPNCKWQGALADAAGIITSEKVYDTKAVVDLLIYVATKYASGPLAQAFLMVGLLEKDDQEGMDKVMRAAMEGLIKESFTAAAEHAAQKAGGADAA